MALKVRGHIPFQHAFSALRCVFDVLILVGKNKLSTRLYDIESEKKAICRFHEKKKKSSFTYFYFFSPCFCNDCNVLIIMKRQRRYSRVSHCWKHANLVQGSWKKCKSQSYKVIFSLKRTKLVSIFLPVFRT